MKQGNRIIRTTHLRGLLLLMLACCTGAAAQLPLQKQSAPLQKMNAPEWSRKAFSVAFAQSEKMFETVKSTSRLPRSIHRGMVEPADWTAGFFPGTLWYLYAYTNDSTWRNRAEQATSLLKQEQFNAFDHDVGFKMYCSYGNGLLLTGNKEYRQIIFRSAKTLSSRYSYKTGLIMSWEPDESRDWQFPVIIDNMMNLELLMEAYKLSGDTTLKHIAISHADKTMKYQYRDNLSCPHVVDYHAESGAVRKFDWNNGSDDTKVSTWSRGQSWGLYGYTMMYRETGDKKYLQHAERIADFLLNHPNMPKDLIPYWDYSAPHRSKMRDASAAALMASALMELSTYSTKGKQYFDAGERQLQALSSPEYLAEPGTHNFFILKHATGNFLRNSELDGALSYADYYYMEGLLRYLKLINNRSLFDGFHQFAQSFKVGDKEVGKGNGIALLPMDCIRQKGNREFPYPTKGHTLITNPPTFTWPMADYEYPETFPAKESDKRLNDYARYDFQIGRTKEFSDKESMIRSGLRLPFYNNHQALEPGVWYWRYRVSGKKWSETLQVNIPASTPLFESPKADKAYGMLSAQHPRIYQRLDARKAVTPDQKALIKILKSKANAVLGKEAAHYEVKAAPIPATASEAERVQIMRFRLRYEVEAICSDISSLLSAYQITAEEKYLTKAISLSDYIASKDPIAMYKAADFTGSKSMSTLAMAYDMVYNRLSAEQKKGYEGFIRAVAALVIEDAMQENIGSADGILCAHFFQHTFHDVFCTAMVMKNHLPEAEVWFGMLYDIWLSRSPGGGFLADGVWPNGNMGYIHVNMESMVGNYLLYRNLFGVNLFKHPWYANCANALAYTVPLESAGDGFGDGSEGAYSVNPVRSDFAYILGQELNNPLAMHYAYEASTQSVGQPYVFNKTNFASYRLQHQPHQVEPLEKKNVPQSAVFPQTGIVTMNTDVLDAQKNLFVSFRSSPFGVGSHGLAEQNSFNVSYKGKPLFYPTGYRVTTQDKHYLLAQKHSRARNTITVNGKTQAYSHSGYGWIARYLDGESMTYTLGDASKAYTKFDKSAINWITVLRDAQAYTPEHGFILDEKDDPKVKKFRRHLALLRPNILVVYDELESEKPVTWTFQLNGLQRSHLKIDASDNSLIADTDNCDALAKLFGSTGLTVSLADTSYVKPFDWLNPQRGRPAKVFEKQQFHSKFENTKKCKAMRFLAIIQIDESNSMSFVDVKPDADQVITIGNYRIKGELDINKEARLEIENQATGEYLLYGPTGQSTKAQHRKFSHSTILIDKANGLQESIDRYPLMVPLQQ